MNTKLERLLVDAQQGGLKQLLHGIAREIVHADNPYELRDVVEAVKDDKLTGHAGTSHNHAPPPRRPEPEEPEDEHDDETDDEEEETHERRTPSHPRSHKPQRHRK